MCATLTIRHIWVFHLVLLYNIHSAVGLEEGDLFCTYPISGSYGSFPRFILYGLFLIGVLFHRWDWLVGAAFGTAILFSSVASVHLIAITATNNLRYWDPDSVPAFNVVCYSVLASSVLLMWSTSFCYAKSSTHITVFAWMVIMLAGLIAGIVYDYQDVTIVGGLSECTETLPLRSGQSPIVMTYEYLYSAPVNLPSPTFFLGILSTLQIPLCIACGLTGKNPRSFIERFIELLLKLLGLGRKPWHLRNMLRTLMMYYFWLVHIGFSATVLWIIVLGEWNMVRPGGWYQGETIATIGQWSQIASTLFTFVSAAIVSWCKQREAKRIKELEDLERLCQTSGTLGTMHCGHQRPGSPQVT